jgi:DNA-binding transcriptional MocR family regulator
MNSKQPLYQKIAETIKARIATGQFRPGQKIPPIRDLTASLGVNKATVHKAFEQLKREGLIENRVGSGSYVRFPEKIHAPAGFFDFRTDYLNERLFPYQQAQAIFNQLFENEKAHALAPTPVEGDPELLRVLSRRYHLPAERMLIISGAQQGLDLVSKVFAAKISESILFEDPTYPGAISLFKARHFVTLQGDGPDLDQLDRGLSASIQLFYTMPSVHNPTGIAYSMAKKEAVAQRAQAHGFYIIEDDYLGELNGRAARMIDIAPQRTIHIKSFAQTTLAGIRLGLMVVPEDLYAQFAYAKYSSDISSTGLLQKFLRDFITQGLYDQHLTMVVRQAAQRRERLNGLLGQYPFLTLRQGQSGYSLWCASTIPIPLIEVPWCPGQEFSFSQEYRRFFKVSFMNLDDEAFTEGLEYLKRCLSHLTTL